MKPIRIQRKRTKGWKMPENTVYVGRPSSFGNPFRVGKPNMEGWEDLEHPNTSARAVELFERYFALTWRIGLITDDLRGKNLACWCALDEPCHADVLLKIANL